PAVEVAFPRDGDVAQLTVHARIADGAGEADPLPGVLGEAGRLAAGRVVRVDEVIVVALDRLARAGAAEVRHDRRLVEGEAVLAAREATQHRTVREVPRLIVDLRHRGLARNLERGLDGLDSGLVLDELRMARAGQVAEHGLAGERDRVGVARRPVGRVRRAVGARAVRAHRPLNRSVAVDHLRRTRYARGHHAELVAAIEVADHRRARALADEVDRLVVTEGACLDRDRPVGHVGAAAVAFAVRPDAVEPRLRDVRARRLD